VICDTLTMTTVTFAETSEILSSYKQRTLASRSKGKYFMRWIFYTDGNFLGLQFQIA